MLTRCPYCQTHFRVVPEQLKRRFGKVRCGACYEVFDAFENLGDEPVVPGLSATEANAEPSVAATSPDGGDSADEEPKPAPEDPLSLPDEPSPPSAEGAAAEAPKDRAAPAPSATGPSRWLWMLGLAALALLAVGQLLYIFRAELAVSSPALRPVLTAGCALFGCRLSRPAKPEMIQLETSDLAPQGEAFLLTAVLKNRAGHDLDYPHLELALTSARDEPLVRKILSPADYLPAGRSASAGFAAHDSVEVRLELSARDVPAVGYRLYLFYP